MKLQRFIKSWFMHWHYWEVVPIYWSTNIPVEYALDCKCGISARMHLGEIVAKGAARICNQKAKDRRREYIQTGIIKEMTHQG